MKTKEKLIQQARQMSLPELDMFGIGMKRLPNEIGMIFIIDGAS
jgi:hypothetical protein